MDGQGAPGFLVYFYLCQRAYGSHGYYYSWSYDDAATTARKIGGGVGSETVRQTVSLCLRIGLFSDKLFAEHGIITSRGIQKRYVIGMSERIPRPVIKEYWLLTEEESAGLIPNAQKTSFPPGNGGFTPPKPGISPPKCKEKKRKGMKGEERKAPASPTPAEQREELERKYGKTLVEVYLTKVGKYRYEGDKAIEKAAQWLTEDEARGKITALPPKEETSLDMEGYMAQVMTYAPKYRKDDGV